MNISKNTTVMINYELKDTEGNLLESTTGVEGVSYLHGQGMMLPGLEEALEGKAPGEKLTVSLSCEDAYGARDDKLVMEIPRSQFEDPDSLAIGEDIQVHDGQAGGVMTIVGLSDDSVTLDGNHPYSGRDVVFAMEVLDVRETTEEDIAAVNHHHGHDCGCGHDHEGHEGHGGCCGGSGGSETDEDDCCGGGNGGGGCCGH